MHSCAPSEGLGVEPLDALSPTGDPDTGNLGQWVLRKALLTCWALHIPPHDPECPQKKAQPSARPLGQQAMTITPGMHQYVIGLSKDNSLKDFLK